MYSCVRVPVCMCGGHRLLELSLRSRFSAVDMEGRKKMAGVERVGEL